MFRVIKPENHTEAALRFASLPCVFPFVYCWSVTVRLEKVKEIDYSPNGERR